jgi:hypothetical protein
MIWELGRWLRRAAWVRAGYLVAYMACLAPALSSHAADAPDFTAVGVGLNNAVEAFAKGVSPDQASKAPADKRNELLGTVKKSIEELAKYERIDLFGAFINETGRLASTFNELQKDVRKLEALRDINRVDAKAKDKADQLAAIDKEHSAELYAALSKLRAILTAVGPSRRINVVGAWYGDRDTILSVQPKSAWESKPRYCAATAAVQALCEGRSACFSAEAETDNSAAQSPTGSSADITGAKMCGYDPVPYATAETKALIVLYSCLSVSDEDWKEQLDLAWRGFRWSGGSPDPGKGAAYKGVSAKGIPGALTGPTASDVGTPIEAKNYLGAEMRASKITEIRCYRGNISP